MKMIHPEVLRQLRDYYKPGTRVTLIKMDDPFTKLKPGDRGSIHFIDDAGTAFVNWDCGSSLGVVFSIDEIGIIEE